jgi:hypothetical protein
MVFNVEPGIHVDRYGGARLRPVRGDRRRLRTTLALSGQEGRMRTDATLH